MAKKKSPSAPDFKGLFATVENLDDLKKMANDFRDQLIGAFNARKAELAPDAPDATDEPKSVEAEEKPKEVVKISVKDKEAVAKLGLTMEQYSEKSWVLRGDTKPIKDALKKIGGRYNPGLKGGEGWIFSAKTAKECAKTLSLSVEIA